MSSVETQFHVPPFPPFPSAERYVRVGSQDDALQRVRRAVEAWEAISLVIGPPGTGKSLICQVLQQHFARDREVIVFGDATLESPQSLQRHLLSRLDRIRGIAPTPVAVGDDPQLAIIERIAGSSKEFAGLLLLVDEAQTLKPEVLETIRILTNVMSGGRPRVSAVLLGGPKLDETLALPSLDALVQRVSTRCYVHPLSSDETVQYVQQTIQNCVSAAKVGIEESAIRSIHRACSGVPRLVNQLMTATIEFATSRGHGQITDQTVDHAWAVLQQLPSPLMEEPELSRPVSSVEFGPLCDEDNAVEFGPMTDSPGMIESSSIEFETELETENANPEPDFEDTTDEVPAREKSVAFEAESVTRNCGENCGGNGDCDPESCDASECQSGCAKAEQATNTDFTMQTEVAIACDSDVAFESVSYDCGATGTFDYDEQVEASDETEEPVYAETKPVIAFETPSPDELFGEFDEEEPVVAKLGDDSAIACETSATCQSAEAPEQHAGEEQHGEDLESSLHREILSLRGDASAPVLWMEDGEPDPLVDDDRDMLVIEDDVEVEEAITIGEAKTDETPGTPVAVDFQSMLAKMRSPKR
ncbi:ExeA family protein [Rhodopirellula sp. SWK7]|uniref:ExeA family protein n=1 Tax=Rhodopirellula sp. SWK7 TaxID=595460 RepID=UPI0005C5E569|nr:AAA family ATPase [Rhodopirellula sp. SWK7]